MVTSGTGHDRCPSPGPGPTGARAPPFDGDRKISKTVFGFKRAEEFSLKPLDTPAKGAMADAKSTPSFTAVVWNRSPRCR